MWSTFWLLFTTFCCLGILGSREAPGYLEQTEDKVRQTRPCHLSATCARLNYFGLSFWPVEWGKSWLSWGPVKLTKPASSSRAPGWGRDGRACTSSFSPLSEHCMRIHISILCFGPLLIYPSVSHNWPILQKVKMIFYAFCISGTQHSSRCIAGSQSMFAEGW